MIFRSGGGCWFCPNARYFELKHLRTCHRHLWDRLLGLEDEEDLIGDIWNTLTGRSMKDNEEMFFWEEAQMDIFDFLDILGVGENIIKQREEREKEDKKTA